MKIWQCKIGESVSIPNGADAPMREAVARAYKELTGEAPTFIFSGWGAELTEPERAVVENRLPALSRYSGQPASCDCDDKSQCWEPCGDLGHDAEHAKLSSGQPAASAEPVIADARKMVPSDDELLKWAGEEQFFLFCDEDEFLQIAREVLSRYGSSQPAALSGVRSPDGYAYRYADGIRFTDGREINGCRPIEGIPYWFGTTPPVESKLATPVAQEPPQVTDAEIEQIVTGAGARWDGSVWKVEDADLHPMARALLYRYTTAPVAVQPVVTDEMVTRFLGWHLPQDFMPDCGISFSPSPDPHSWPVGTNLLTDPQARAMLEYVLQGAPVAAQAQPSGNAGELSDEREAFVAWLSGEFPHAWPVPMAERAWDNNHVAALAWRHAVALPVR